MRSTASRGSAATGSSRPGPSFALRRVARSSPSRGTVPWRQSSIAPARSGPFMTGRFCRRSSRWMCPAERVRSRWTLSGRLSRALRKMVRRPPSVSSGCMPGGLSASSSAGRSPPTSAPPRLAGAACGSSRPDRFAIRAPAGMRWELRRRSGGSRPLWRWSPRERPQAGGGAVRVLPKMCRFSCPVSEATAREALSPWEGLAAARAGLRGNPSDGARVRLAAA